jgi:hypothetical protein
MQAALLIVALAYNLRFLLVLEEIGVPLQLEMGSYGESGSWDLAWSNQGRFSRSPAGLVGGPTGRPLALMVC